MNSDNDILHIGTLIAGLQGDLSYTSLWDTPHPGEIYVTTQRQAHEAHI